MPGYCSGALFLESTEPAGRLRLSKGKSRLSGVVSLLAFHAPLPHNDWSKLQLTVVVEVLIEGGGGGVKTSPKEYNPCNEAGYLDGAESSRPVFFLWPATVLSAIACCSRNLVVRCQIGFTR